MSFPNLFQNSLFLFVLLRLYFFGYWLLDFFNGFLLVFEDFRGSFIYWLELLFLIEVLRGFILDLEVTKLSHLLFHVEKIAIEESFFLDEVVKIKLLDSVRTDVFFIGFVGWLIFVVNGLGFYGSIWWLFGFRLWFGFAHVWLLFGVEGIGSFSINLDEEVFDLF